jgi:hypothetical protein
MSWLFGSKPAPAKKLSCPANTLTKEVVEEKDYPTAFECYTELKKEKGGMAGVRELTNHVDGLRAQWDAWVESSLRMNERSSDEVLAKLKRDTAAAKPTIKSNTVLTKDEKKVVYQYLYATENQAIRNIRRGRLAANAAARNAGRAAIAAERAVAAAAARNVAAERAAEAGAAAIGAAAAGNARAAANRLAAMRRAAGNVRRAEAAEERAVAATGRAFAHNVTRRAAANNAAGARAAGAASRTNTALATYAAPAPAPAVAGAGTGLAPARPPVPGGRFAATLGTGAPAEYAGGRRHRKTRRTLQRSRRGTQRRRK